MPSCHGQQLDQPLMLRVIKTLVYFKARGIRLTRVDVGRLLIGVRNRKSDAPPNIPVGCDPRRLGDVALVLDYLEKLGVVNAARGFYEWRGAARETRSSSCLLPEVDAKLKKAERAVRCLRHIPFIGLLGVCGTVATGNCKPSSDIDFFVIADQGRIWTARFLLMIVLEVLGMRKKPDRVRDRVCLNHFVVSGTAGVKHRDLYAALEFAKMIVLFDRDGERELFMLENTWIEEYFPEIDFSGLHACSPRPGGDNMSNLQALGEFLLKGWPGNALEHMLKIFQEGRIRRKRRQEKGGQVYWGDDALVFHPKPKGIVFAARYRQLLEEDQDVIKKIIRGAGVPA